MKIATLFRLLPQVLIWYIVCKSQQIVVLLTSSNQQLYCCFFTLCNIYFMMWHVYTHTTISYTCYPLKGRGELEPILAEMYTIIFKIKLTKTVQNLNLFSVHRPLLVNWWFQHYIRTRNVLISGDYPDKIKLK